MLFQKKEKLDVLKHFFLKNHALKLAQTLLCFLSWVVLSVQLIYFENANFGRRNLSRLKISHFKQKKSYYNLISLLSQKSKKTLEQ